MGNKILHYRIKYQDSNVAIIKFSKDEISDFLKNSLIWIEEGEDVECFWECFEDSLIEIHGIDFLIVDGYEIVVNKALDLPNWGRIIENVIWCSVLFLNPDGGAMEISAEGKNIGKIITHSFDATEPKPPRKK